MARLYLRGLVLSFQVSLSSYCLCYSPKSLMQTYNVPILFDQAGNIKKYQAACSKIYVTLYNNGHIYNLINHIISWYYASYNIVAFN